MKKTGSGLLRVKAELPLDNSLIHLNYGYRNENGIIKYECKNCKAVSVRKQKGRRHDTIDLYAPVGQVRYE